MDSDKNNSPTIQPRDSKKEKWIKINGVEIVVEHKFGEYPSNMSNEDILRSVGPLPPPILQKCEKNNFDLLIFSYPAKKIVVLGRVDPEARFGMEIQKQ
jgi:hypothetical protein